jgi:hypothetical protein
VIFRPSPLRIFLALFLFSGQISELAFPSEAKARSSAAPIWRGSVTVSPPPPSARTTSS